MGHHQHTPEVHAHADQWHHHDAAAEGAPQQEHTGIANPIMLARWFVAIVVTFALMVVFIWMYFTSYATALKAERIETTALSREAIEAKLAAESALGMGQSPFEYKWADGKAGTVTIPINEAMKKVQSRYEQGRQASVTESK